MHARIHTHTHTHTYTHAQTAVPITVIQNVPGLQRVHIHTLSLTPLVKFKSKPLYNSLLQNVQQASCKLLSNDHKPM
uniref:Uncharacterized protein n=1 Tax=Anguilla anguilla TaxID=7936 RepID=A0A0E9SNT3_ANGAN